MAENDTSLKAGARNILGNFERTPPYSSDRPGRPHGRRIIGPMRRCPEPSSRGQRCRTGPGPLARFRSAGAGAGAGVDEDLFGPPPGCRRGRPRPWRRARRRAARSAGSPGARNRSCSPRVTRTVSSPTGKESIWTTRSSTVIRVGSSSQAPVSRPTRVMGPRYSVSAVIRLGEFGGDVAGTRPPHPVEHALPVMCRLQPYDSRPGPHGLVDGVRQEPGHPRGVGVVHRTRLPACRRGGRVAPRSHRTPRPGPWPGARRSPAGAAGTGRAAE